MSKSEVFKFGEFGISSKQEGLLTTGFNRAVCLPNEDQIRNHGLVALPYTGASGNNFFVVEYRKTGIPGGVRAGISGYLNYENYLFRPTADVLAKILMESKAHVLPYMVNPLHASLLSIHDGGDGVIGAFQYRPNCVFGHFRLFSEPESGIPWEQAYKRSGLDQVVEMGKVLHGSEPLTTVESPYSYPGSGLINTAALGIDNARQALRWFYKDGSTVTLTSRAAENR
ncbi:MAG: hypothetical protein NUV65_02630 [Candidatus Roizmanbacteria bacterium]|nr:hypothetical protein [Candidatus Roizmanbacteria bacterium]